jgi:hypothetical protein
VSSFLTKHGCACRLFRLIRLRIYIPVQGCSLHYCVCFLSPQRNLDRHPRLLLCRLFDSIVYLFILFFLIACPSLPQVQSTKHPSQRLGNFTIVRLSTCYGRSNTNKFYSTIHTTSPNFQIRDVLKINTPEVRTRRLFFTKILRVMQGIVAVSHTNAPRRWYAI